jgi:type II secretory pathway pseudopilin PulG
MNLITWVAILGLLLGTIAPAWAQNPDSDERIQALERQLAAQRAMIAEQQAALESMQSELNQLKSERTTAPDDDSDHVSLSDEDTGAAVEENSALTISGFVNLDMIYDFDRVAPEYEATLVPTTIPTVPGQYGTDGNFIVSIKQSRLAFLSEMDTPWAQHRPSSTSTCSAPAATPAEPPSISGTPGSSWAAGAQARPGVPS